jgi:replicative DNA helicase
LDEVGGQAYLATLSSYVPTSSNVKHYADIVQKKATLRRILSSASELSELGFDEKADVEHILDRAERLIFSVSQKFHKHVFIPIKNLLEEAFDRIDAIHRSKGQLRGTATGFADLDSLLSGLQKSDLIIVASRPSVGKSARRALGGKPLH